MFGTWKQVKKETRTVARYNDNFQINSDAWCFGDKSDVHWAVIFVYHISYDFGIKQCLDKNILSFF